MSSPFPEELIGSLLQKAKPLLRNTVLLIRPCTDRLARMS